ncbi:MAG: phasin family protein [Desulfovibrionaceae bacterium]|jgi:poly(hydroxyalkanoate) granule-associated protein|nr:phasin family protein [Desulfovibrionaceae bacterium]
MTAKSRKSAAPDTSDAPGAASGADADAAPASAHNIWLAGLGALASAQAEGSKVFEALVQQGIEMQSKTQSLAKERMAEVAQRMESITRQAAGAVAPTWNRLGGIFEDRVAQALTGLGMPTAQELAALTARVEALERALGQAQPEAARPPASRAAARKKS